MNPALQLLKEREAFWAAVQRGSGLSRTIVHTMLFIVVATALYGAVLAWWRSPLLALYVAVKLPILFLGTTAIVMMLNWMVAVVLRSGLHFLQVVAITFGAMGVTCWILLSLVPVTLFLTLSSVSSDPSTVTPGYVHNLLLLTHISLIAMAGVAGNAALLSGLRKVVAPGCPAALLYVAWVAAFAFVGAQLSWILRPFVGSPYFPVEFLRADALDRNFYEFVFLEVIPNVLRHSR